MKKSKEFLPLFRHFINDSISGKRLKKNGEKISSGTVSNYKYTLDNLEEFSKVLNFDLRICDANKLTQREKKSEKIYWKKFYRKYTDCKLPLIRTASYSNS